MSDHHEAKQATPPETLLAELLDSRVPKSEREHAAKREIERLRAERDELRRQISEAETDARRYRDWLRGGANIPPESNRWPRWEVRCWNGRFWNTLLAEAMDAAIDEAMGLTRPDEET